jgi:hypothetical protein
MTALCGGGSSAPKALTDVVAYYSAGRAAQLLLAAGIAEFSPILPLAGLIPLVASTFCGTDPPTMTALTSAEATALLNLQFGADFDSGLGKFKDILLNLLWNDMCECTSGTYTPPVAPASPSDIPQIVLPVPGPTVPCKVGTVSAGPSQHVSGVSGSFIGGVAKPIGGVPTGYRATFTLTASSASPSTVQLTIRGTPAASPVSNLQTQIMVVGTTYQILSSWPNGANEVDLDLQSLAGGGSDVSFNATVEIFCNGDQPTATIQPCCPPDPATQNYLDIILRTVTLIQRQAVPFAYVASTSHTGLSGAGSIDISGLLGAKVSVTTLPASYGRAGSSPLEVFDLGFITFGTADGFPSSYRLERTEQLLLPVRCSAYTQIDYDLAPGVVIDLVELLREP